MKKSLFSVRNMIKAVVFIALAAFLTFNLEPALSVIFQYPVIVAAVLAVLIGLMVFFRKTNTGNILRSGLLLLAGSLITALAMSFLLPALGINLQFRVEETLTGEEAGPADVILNSGRIAQAGSYVFYIEPRLPDSPTFSNAGNLIRRDTDWTDRIQVTDNPVRWFAASETQIYYIDDARSQLFRMGHDGSARTLISEDPVQSCAVSGDDAVFQSSAGIFHIASVGADPVPVTDNGGPLHPELIDGWIYYRPALNSLARIRPDGTGHEELVTGMDGFTLSDGLIYTINKTPIQPVGWEVEVKSRLLEDPAQTPVKTLSNVFYATLSGDHLYYQQGTGKGQVERGLYQLDLKTGEAIKINKISAWEIEEILGDWMYVLQYSNDRFRIKLDGSVAVPFE